MSIAAAMTAACAVMLALAGSPRSPARRPAGPLRSGPTPPGGCIAAFELVATEVRSGASVPAAVQTALDLHTDVLPALREGLRRGLTLERALDELPARLGRDERWFTHSLRLCHATGGAAADVLDRAVAVARERRAWAAERRAQAAQARLSARLLTVLPIGFAMWGLVSSAQVRHAYVSSPVVIACALIGSSLNVLGWWWMRHLTERRPS